MNKFVLNRPVLLSVFALSLGSGAYAQSWAQKWDWPLLPIHQSYNVGEAGIADTEVGGVGHYWQYPDTAEAAVLPTTAVATKPKVATSGEPPKAPSNP